LIHDAIQSDGMKPTAIERNRDVQPLSVNKPSRAREQSAASLRGNDVPPRERSARSVK